MTMKLAIARTLALAFVFLLNAGNADAQGWFGQKSNDENSELTVRIQRLEQQLRELTGKNEELQHQNDVLTQQLNASRGGPPSGQPPLARTQDGPPHAGPMNSPGMTQGSITQPPLAEPPYSRQQYGGPPPAQPQYDQRYGPPPAQTAVRPGPAPRGDEFDPSAHPNAPGAPRPLGAPLDMGAIANGRQGAPSEPPPINNRAPQQEMAVLPPSNSPKDEYDLAYGYILRRDYALAEQAFRVFLKSHPDDRLVSDASYWLGESQYQRQLYNDAAENFLNVYNKYPKSPKAPDALLRLGQSLAAIGKQDAACATLGEVLKKYPKASSQVKKQVGSEQKRIRC